MKAVLRRALAQCEKVIEFSNARWNLDDPEMPFVRGHALLARSIQFRYALKLLRHREILDEFDRAKEKFCTEDPESQTIFINEIVGLAHWIQDLAEDEPDPKLWPKVGFESLDDDNVTTDRHANQATTRDSSDDQIIVEQKVLSTRQRSNLLMLVAAMAIKGYSFDPAASKNEATSDIETDLLDLGGELTAETIRGFVREGSALLEKNKKKLLATHNARKP